MPRRRVAPSASAAWVPGSIDNVLVVKAIRYSTPGDSSVLELVDRDILEPGPDEVRVRVAVSGVNPTDWKLRTNGPVTSSKVPNQDGAGTIDAVGAAVEGLAIGDRVWLWDVAYGTNEGTAQQCVTLPASHVVPLPEGESFDVGASLGIPALTAHLALTASENGPRQLKPGALADKVVLVTGGAGAVGHAAIQLAVWAGATVITTVSSEDKAELARRAGAHHTINYKTDDVPAAVKAVAPSGVDVIVDVSLVSNVADDVASIASNGTISAYTDDGGPEVTIPVRAMMSKNVRLRFVLTYTVSAEAKANAVDAVSNALAAGVLRVGEEAGLPVTRFPLEETAAAHDAVQNGVVGKVLIDVE
jgi:NADPH:quinone reductase